MIIYKFYTEHDVQSVAVCHLHEDGMPPVDGVEVKIAPCDDDVDCELCTRIVKAGLKASYPLKTTINQ